MNTTTIMKDPAFRPVLYAIETRIMACVRTAKAAGIELNDSQLRSVLNKVRKSSEGKSPQIPNESPRDQVLAALHAEILSARQTLLMGDGTGEEKVIPVSIWNLCIRTVEESIQRHSSGPGSQAYQRFLESFLQ
jgi:hypothetical protein